MADRRRRKTAHYPARYSARYSARISFDSMSREPSVSTEHVQYAHGKPMCGFAFGHEKRIWNKIVNPFPTPGISTFVITSSKPLQTAKRTFPTGMR